ncbi:MAG: protein translocase subunit SecF [Endomicrobiia bacterium]
MKEIELMNKRKFFMLLSLIFALFTVGILIINRGLNLGLDFTGGTIIHVKFNTPTVEILQLRNLLSENKVPTVEIQNVITHTKEYKEFLIKVKSTQEEVSQQIEEIFKNNNLSYEIIRREFVGPTIGKHLTRKAFLAIIFSLAGIIVYVAIRFGSSIWGISGVIALVHDVFLTVGFLTLLGKEINLTIIAALLTLAGYSINDTIVIFDRIRENIKLLKKESLIKIIDISINQTLTRTLLTSGTTLMAVISLFILGNRIIKDFALTLLFGVIVGTYSSIFIASALVLEYNLITQK